MKPERGNYSETLPYGVQENVMAVHDQKYQDCNKILKLRYNGHLLIIDGIDHVHNGEAHLKTYKLSGKLDPIKNQPGSKPNHDADHDLSGHAEY